MKLIQHFSGCLLVLSLSACGSFWNIGESKLSCDAETGMGCTGIRAAYMATDNYSPEQDAKNHWVRKSQSSNPYSQSKASQYGYNANHSGVADFVPAVPSYIPTASGAGRVVKPLRQPEQIMRVWVNSHEDENGNLVYPSHTFTQVSEAHWANGTPRSKAVKTKTILPPKATNVVAMPVADAPASNQVSDAGAAASDAASAVQNQEADNQDE